MLKKKLFYLLMSFAVLFSCGEKEESLPIVESSSTQNFTYPLANGTYNYVSESYEEKGKILAQLESYTLNHFIGGIPLYDSSSQIMYHSRVQLPLSHYVNNIGFGESEGKLTEDLQKEPVAAFKRYFHTWTNADPSTFNGLNASGSDVSEICDLFQSSYYDLRLNQTKDNYEWISSLAKEDPIPLNLDANGLATKFLVKLHHNEENYVYDIETKNEKLKKYQGMKILLEDYLTPFQLACEQNWYRASSDLASTSSGFVGVAEYLTAISQHQQADWSKVGIQLDPQNGGIVFEFIKPKTVFYAKYNLSSRLFAPIRRSFIDDIGGIKNYGKTGLVDSVLSTGMYTLSHYQSGSNFALRKNPYHHLKNQGYYEGYHYAILANRNVAFSEFEAGKLDKATIPTSKLKEYENHPRKRVTLGETVWKFQVNSCSKSRYEELFGENGIIYPHAKKDYWEIKPLLSNQNFLNGLYYAINRQEMASWIGKRPAQGFLSDAYLIDPEKGISFRDTEAGKSVLKARLSDTYGYDSGIAKRLFQKAVEEEASKGNLKIGSSQNPTEIHFVTWFQSESQTQEEGNFIRRYWEETFNQAVEGVKIVLDAKYTSDYMDCYLAMMQGEYDFGFGSISGNTFDPISFMDSVCSDNRSSFTLSWGADTSRASSDIVYQNMHFSYEGLLDAALGSVTLKDGEAQKEEKTSMSIVKSDEIYH